MGSAMALARLQALEKYLEECRSLSNFSQIAREQCLQVVKEVQAMEKLDLSEGGPLLACVHQNKLWSDEEKEMISQAVHSKVKEHLIGKAVHSRLPMQQFQNFPIYLTDSDWNAVLSESTNVQHKCDVVMTRLHALGLRAPSEDTLAMLTVVLLLRDSQRLSDGVQLRSSYLTVKQMVKTFLKGQKEVRRDENHDFVEKLPPDPAALPQLNSLYTAGEKPGGLPHGVDMEHLLRLMSLVPQRSTSRSISMQIPKATSHSLMDNSVVAAQQMAAQMFMASMGNMAAFHGYNLHPGFQPSGNASSSVLRPLPPPVVPPPLPAPESGPQHVDASNVEVVPVVKPSPAKALKAIRDRDDPPADQQAVAPTKTAARPANITTVNEQLEEALGARDQSKKEKKEEAEEQKQVSEKKETEQAQKKPAGQSKSMKKPAAGSMKRPSAVVDAPPVKRHRKGPIPGPKLRLKLMPQGCSKCRHRQGCTNSCWLGRGYGDA